MQGCMVLTNHRDLHVCFLVEVRFPIDDVVPRLKSPVANGVPGDVLGVVNELHLKQESEMRQLSGTLFLFEA